MKGGIKTSLGPKYLRLPQHPPATATATTHALPEKQLERAKASRCPKLSRYKLMAATFVVTVTVVILGFACLRSRQSTLATCLQTNSLDRDVWQQDSQGGNGSPSHLRYSHTKRHLPHCLIIGARKAGTRALLYFLNLHSQIQTAGREIHFFDMNYEQGLEWYRKQMPFSFKDVPERVYRMNSSVKLLLIIRDPIDRTVKRHKPIIPFEKLALDQETFEINKSYTAIKRSIYVRHLQRWLQFFPLSQIHIVDGDHLVTKPWEEIAKVEEFLGLEHQITQDKFTLNKTRGFYCFRAHDMDHCLAEGKGRQHPDIDPYILKKLIAFFEPFNEKFFDRIGRRFEWRHWQ
ncbi:hypothetical protein BaRGS_00018329 [Batillaria attramentaria]|uniref:Sulfotransferase domain-containing protein n=1 Tax=Batillaria attramentaria TaxID=370345 RepID=A0ABD0KT58_9CAEN